MIIFSLINKLKLATDYQSTTFDSHANQEHVAQHASSIEENDCVLKGDTTHG